MIGKQKSIATAIVEDIMQKVASGELAPGTKLKNEFELAKEYAVGRSSIREAVKILVSRNVLEIHRGNGTFVKAIQGPLSDLFDIEDASQMLLDLYEFRLTVEPEMARLAALRANEVDLKRIQKALEACEAKIKAHKSHQKEDIAFHLSIAKATHNQAFIQLMPTIHDGVLQFIAHTQSHLLQMTLDTHARIATAIKNHNGSDAYEAMREHIMANLKPLKIAENEGSQSSHS